MVQKKKYYQNTWQGIKKFESGILYNQGIHLIDLILKNLKNGSAPRVISCYRDNIYHKSINTEDIFIAQFKAGNTLCNIDISVAASPKNMNSGLLLIFEKGRIEIDGLALNGYLKLTRKNYEDIKVSYDNPDNDVYGYGHKVLIKELSKYILSGKRNENLVDFDTAAKRIEFVSELYHKAK